MTNSYKILLATVAILVAANSAAAADSGVYRTVLSNGQVVYSDKPADTGQASKPVVIFTPSGITSGISAAEIAATNKRIADRMLKTDELRDKKLSALDKLQASQKSKIAGVEPLPGERKATKRGSRLTEDYWDRQQQLTDAEAKAQKGYDDASTDYRDSM